MTAQAVLFGSDGSYLSSLSSSSISKDIDIHSAILDIDEGTTSSPPLPVSFGSEDYCRNQTLLFSRCHDCHQVYCVSQDCDSRACPACQKKRAKLLFLKYLDTVRNWVPDHPVMRIQFLTLTIKNVPECTRGWLDRQDKNLANFIQRLSRRGYVADYGFICKEMTYHAIGSPKYSKRGREVGVYTERDYGYHYHYHLLFYGPRIDLKDPKFNLSDIWRDITKDSFIVNLRPHRRPAGRLFFQSALGALSYMMKYVCKPQSQSEAMLHYYRVSKGKRYFQTFGQRFKVPKKSKSDTLKLLCYRCGGSLGSGYRVFSENVPSSWDLSSIQPYCYSRLRSFVSLKSQEDEGRLSRAQSMIRRVAPHVWKEPHNEASIMEVLTDDDLFFLRDKGYIFHARSDQWRLFE